MRNSMMLLTSEISGEKIVKKFFEGSIDSWDEEYMELAEFYWNLNFLNRKSYSSDKNDIILIFQQQK